ncbi:signal peptide-containing protein [Rhodopirellula maiorica SM1]|uniref:Signal peptide-containing protein n=1 Tax=Rhodopirellula maiorica SM1 TaxID=1265738 RepID=M5RE69_9BACT|nr:hypothetical protein [Rhodopirellula maiorica]EMI17675.1 signal peptide-containing protein [Rhodopirellula maiorica SM1]
MLRLKEAAVLGTGLLSARRVILAGAAALGLYNFGDEGVSYLSTAGRLVSEEVGDQVPIRFELERAKTMIDSLVPDIKRNMIVIAKEEVSVETIRDEVKSATGTLQKQRMDLMTLRDEAVKGSKELRIGNRIATDEEVSNELKRLFARFKLAEATLGAKQDLLISRESSLTAARKKLESMLNAKRDLEVQVENLEARLTTVQGDAVSRNVDFDESNLARCQELVDDLRVRLQVAERLIVTNGEIEDLATTITIGNEDVLAQINEYLGSRSPSDEVAKGI